MSKETNKQSDVIPEYSYLLNGKDLCGMGLLDESARIRDGNSVVLPENLSRSTRRSSWSVILG